MSKTTGSASNGQASPSGEPAPSAATTTRPATIIRIAKHTRHYVTLDKQAMEDHRLSWRAVGLHAYLIGRPPHWQVRLEHLADAHQEGREAVTKALHELQNAGYARQFWHRGDKGRFRQSVWVIFETLALAEKSKKPFSDPENPQTAFQEMDNSPENPQTGSPYTANQCGSAVNGKPALETRPLVSKGSEELSSSSSSSSAFSKRVSTQQQEGTAAAAAARFSENQEEEIQEEDKGGEASERNGTSALRPGENDEGDVGAPDDEQSDVIQALREAGISEPTRSMLVREIPGLTREAIYEIWVGMSEGAGTGALITAIRSDAADVMENQAAVAAVKAREAEAEQEKKRAEQQRLEKEKKALNKRFQAEVNGAIERAVANRKLKKRLKNLNGDRVELASRRFQALFGNYALQPHKVDPRAVDQWAVEQEDIEREQEKQEAEYQREKAIEDEKRRAEQQRAIAERAEQQRLEREKREAAVAAAKVLQAEIKAKAEAARNAFRNSFSDDEWAQQVDAFQKKFPAAAAILQFEPHPEKLIDDIRTAIAKGQLEAVAPEKPAS